MESLPATAEPIGRASLPGRVRGAAGGLFHVWILTLVIAAAAALPS